MLNSQGMEVKQQLVMTNSQCGLASKEQLLPDYPSQIISPILQSNEYQAQEVGPLFRQIAMRMFRPEARISRGILPGNRL